MRCIRLQVESVETKSGGKCSVRGTANPLSEFVVVVVDDAPRTIVAVICSIFSVFIILLLFIIVTLLWDRWHCTSLSYKIFRAARKGGSKWIEWIKRVSNWFTQVEWTCRKWRLWCSLHLLRLLCSFAASAYSLLLRFFPLLWQTLTSIIAKVQLTFEPR